MPDLLVSSMRADSVLCYDGTRGRFRGAFIPQGLGGLKQPQGLCFGPDGKLYVSSSGTGQVLRYDGQAFDKIFASDGGLANPAGLVFGPDGNLYVADFAGTNRVLRYNGVTGAFDKSFLSGADVGIVVDLVFGPDNNLYVTGNGTGGGPAAGVFRFNGSSGLFDQAVIPNVSGAGLAFGSDQNLYVVGEDGVSRYDGKTGKDIDLFAAAGPLSNPQYLVFGPDGDLYVGSSNNASVLRYDGSSGQFGGLTGANTESQRMRLPIINIADYPPPVGSDDWWHSYQQAVDTILTSGKPGIIYTPGRSDPYPISKPILADANNLSFVGDGVDVSVIQVNGERYSDAIQFGVARTSRKKVGDSYIDQTLTPFSDFWVDATPILDGSIGQPPRYGLRTKGIAYAYFQGTPFDMGPVEMTNWSATQQLTLDFAIYNPAGWNGGDQGIRLFGLGSPDNRLPSPFYCGVAGSSTTLFFDFATSDSVVRRVQFTPMATAQPLDSYLKRVSIQLDLTQPSVLAFVNGQQVAVDLTGIGPGWAAYLTLRANEYRQFQLGTCLVDAAFNPGNITDQTVFGFKLTSAALYQNSGAGTAQARLDGKTPLNDARQFFTLEEADFSALLPLTNSGNNYRYIPWQSAQPGGAWSGVGSGLFLHDSSLGVPDTLGGNAVRDLTLMAATVPGLIGYGRALCHGPIYDFKAQDCLFIGGAHNFGALNGAVGYPLKVHDCQFERGGDAAIYAQGCGMWWGERLTIKYWGREAIRSLSSFMDLRQVFYAPGGPGDCVLKFHNSVGGVLDNHVMDFEGGGPALAHIYCEAGADSGPTNLTLRNVIFGTEAAGANYVVLRGPDSPSGDYAPATLILESTQHVGFSSIPGIWTVKQN